MGILLFLVPSILFSNPVICKFVSLSVVGSVPENFHPSLIADTTLTPQDLVAVNLPDAESPTIRIGDVRDGMKPLTADTIVARNRNGNAEGAIEYQTVSDNTIVILRMNGSGDVPARFLVNWLIENNPEAAISVDPKAISAPIRDAVLSNGFQKEEGGVYVRSAPPLRVFSPGL